jgi:hypothetical protein
VFTSKQFRPSDYGATGGDDTLAWQAMFDEIAAGPAIVLCDVDSVISSPISTSAHNVDLVSHGGSLTASSVRFEGGIFDLDGCADWNVRNLRIDCGGSDCIPYTSSDYDIRFNLAFNVASSQRIAFHGCRFSNLYTQFIHANGVQDLNVSDCSSHSPAASHNTQICDHYMVKSSTGRIEFAGNTLDNDAPTSDTENACGIALSGISGGSVAIARNLFNRLGRGGPHRLAALDFYRDVENAHVFGNTFKSTNWTLMRFNGTPGLRCHNNIAEVTRAPSDFPLVFIGQGNNALFPTRDITFDSNVIRSSYPLSTVAIGVYTYDYGHRAEGVRVSNNTIEGVDNAILVYGSHDGLDIVRNRIRGGASGTISVKPNPAPTGIASDAVTRGLRIDGNDTAGKHVTVVGESEFSGVRGPVEITRNNVAGDAFGILTEHVDVQIDGNQVAGSIGIFPRFCDVAFVRENVIDSAEPIKGSHINAGGKLIQLLNYLPAGDVVLP